MHRYKKAVNRNVAQSHLLFQYSAGKGLTLVGMGRELPCVGDDSESKFITLSSYIIYGKNKNLRKDLEAFSKGFFIPVKIYCSSAER